MGLSCLADNQVSTVMGMEHSTLLLYFSGDKQLNAAVYFFGQLFAEVSFQGMRATYYPVMGKEVTS